MIDTTAAPSETIQPPRSARPRKPREPLLVFLAKGITFAAAIAIAIVLLAANFKLGYSPQEVKSLPWRVWVVHKTDESVTRNDYVAFLTDERMTDYFPLGTQFVKQVIGVPGDRVVVSDGVIRVNGRRVGEILVAFGNPAAAFERDFTIADDRYWVMGTNPLSYDSRYWGTITQGQVLGQSYPIW